MNAARTLFRLAVLPFVVLLSSASPAHAETRVVTAPSTSVRSAPFDVAPEVARLQSGDRLTADDQPQGDWRRVVLPGGRSGFVRDADTQHAEPAPAATAAAEPTVVVPGAAPPELPSPPPSPEPPAAGTIRYTEAPVPTPPSQLGVAFEMFPVGTLAAFATNGETGPSNDTVFAVGVSAFVDGSLSPWLSLGVSPQVIFRVKPDGAMDESAKEFDFRGRLTGRLPLSAKVRAFARLSPGYSVIDLPRIMGRIPTERPRPTGFVMDASAGVEVAVLPRLFIVSGLGYQMGWQSSSEGALHTSYLHLGAGFAVGL